MKPAGVKNMGPKILDTLTALQVHVQETSCNARRFS